MKKSNIVTTINKSKLTIYDEIDPYNDKLWIPDNDLERIIKKNLLNFNLLGYPLRTRSKVIKQEICKILGYPVPEGFKKTKPRFPGQNFDTYIQKSNNLQIWNEDVDLKRRYVLIKVSEEYKVSGIKVISGLDLVKYDKTGTLTSKYQARINIGNMSLNLLSDKDTENIRKIFILKNKKYPSLESPLHQPSKENLLPINRIFEKLKIIVGKSFKSLGYDQERNRGFEIHKLVCQYLGYKTSEDKGSFPDISNQLLEIKFQTSPTIDLGFRKPDSIYDLNIKMDDLYIRACDIRYCIFYGKIEEEITTITHLYIVTGEDFFKFFKPFGGKSINKKIQLRLPDNLFTT